MPLNIRQRLKQSRAFLFALLAVIMVWFFASMSDEKDFREQYVVQYDGLDTAKFAVTKLDSTVQLDIKSNGFHALQRGLHKHALHISVGNMVTSDNNEVIALNFNTTELLDSLRTQIDMRGVKQVAAVTPLLNLQVARRHSKTFTPNIDDVQFLFDGNSGLYGEPVVNPSMVTLYGSEASLAKIDQIKAEPQTIKHIRTSGQHTIKLDKSWQKYPDLRISSPSVDIYLPVESFIERQYVVPITLPDGNSQQYRLYPENVTLSVLVPLREYSKVKPSDYTVMASTDSDSTGTLGLSVIQFPVHCRIKKISPKEVQFIIIENQ